MISDQITHNAELFRNYAVLFEHQFKVPLTQFWPDHLTGFDILRFNSCLKLCNAHVPLRCKAALFDLVREKFGLGAVVTIKRLISAPPEENEDASKDDKGSRRRGSQDQEGALRYRGRSDRARDRVRTL